VTLQKPKLEKMTKQEKLKEMGRLEVVTKRQETHVEPLQEDTAIIEEAEKVVKIVSSSWRNIISERKQAKMEPEPEPFFLDFGDKPEKP
jgi:hypothetical protein